MIKIAKGIIAPPVFDNEEQNRTLAILNVLLFASLSVLLVRMISFVFLESVEKYELYTVPLLVLGVIFAIVIARKGYVHTISFLLIWSLWIRATFRFFGYDIAGLINIGIAGYYIILIAAELLLGRRSLVFFTILTFLTMTGIYFAGTNGIILPENNPIDSPNILIAYSVNLIILVFFLNEHQKRISSTRDYNRSRTMLQLVLDNIPQFVFWKDKESVYLGCNKNFARAAGVESTEEIVGKKDHELAWKKEEADFFLECDRRVMGNNKGEYHIIEPQLQADSKQAWLDTNKIPLHDSSGNVVGILGTYEDITDRIETEKLLSENEKKYRTLIENINVGIYRTISNPEGKFLHVNLEFVKMLGYDSVDELLEIKVEDTYEEPEKRKEILELIKQHGFFKDIELRLKRKDGTIIWTEISGSLQKDEEGIEYIDGIVVDITNRKLTELALVETEDKLMTVAQNLPVIVWSANKDGILLLSEGKGLESLGLKPGENVGKSLFDLYGELPDLNASLNKVYSGKAVNINVNIGKAYFEAWASPLLDERGKVRGASGLLLDITARRKVEEALLETETNYKSLFENANDAIIIIEPESGRILEANKIALELYGYDHEVIIEKSLFDLCKDSSSIRERIATLIQGTKLGNFETVQYDIENEEIELLVNASLIEYEGRSAILSIHHDITEINRMRDQLNRSQKMESLGRLAGAVAHDLNHILTGLVTYPDLLLLDIDKNDPFRSKIESIKKSGQRAAELVQDLLTMARGGIVNTETVNLNDIITEFLGSTEVKQMKKSKADISIDIGLEPFLKDIECSKIQMLKVLYNLFFNAVEAMPGEGRIYISTSNKSVTNHVKGYDDIPSGNYVVLSVSDTGTGISNEDIQYIFEPYFSKKVLGRSGSGIGLSVVWNVVKNLNGFIDVRSEIEMGTVFDLYIPSARMKKGAADDIPDLVDLFGNGETILLIDDEPEQREIGVFLLSKLNYRPFESSSGEEAVEFLQQNRIDLLLIDMLLGSGIDGLETFKRTLEIVPDQKAIIVSGFSGSDKIKQAQELGAKGFIRKPFTIKEIGEKIKKVLQV